MRLCQRLTLKLQQISYKMLIYFFIIIIWLLLRLFTFFYCKNDWKENIKCDIETVNVAAVFSGGDGVLPARGGQILWRKNGVSPPPLLPARGVRHQHRWVSQTAALWKAFQSHLTAFSLFCGASDLPTAPGNTGTSSHKPRVQWGEVVPMLQPPATNLLPPEAADGEYVYPDSHSTDDLKLGKTGIQMVTLWALGRLRESKRLVCGLLSHFAAALMEQDGVVMLWREEEAIYENKAP